MICFDPGKTTGVALFENKELMQAFSLSGEAVVKEPPEFIDTMLVLIELPRWWSVNNRTDPNDLIDLGLQVGDLCGHYRRQGCVVELVTAREWKGTVDPEVMFDRIFDALTLEEKLQLEKRPKQKSYNHNMLDAVGMGLKKLRRI